MANIPWLRAVLMHNATLSTWIQPLAVVYWPHTTNPRYKVLFIFIQGFCQTCSVHVFLFLGLLCSGLLGSGFVVFSSSWFWVCGSGPLCSGLLGSGFVMFKSSWFWVCWLYCRSQRHPPQLLVLLLVWGERNRNETKEPYTLYSALRLTRAYRARSKVVH